MSNTDDKPPISAIRNSQVYISHLTLKGLRYVSKAKGLTSTDALATDVLWNWLEQSHPEVIKHLRAQELAEADFMDELKKKLGTPIPFAD